MAVLLEEFDRLPERPVAGFNGSEKRTAFAVAGQPDSGFVVTWTAILNEHSVGRFGQIYDRFGNKVSDVFEIAPDLNVSSNLGDFVVFAGRKSAAPA